MKDIWMYITILTLLSFCSGCVTAGLLYSNVTRPLDTNMSETPSGVGKAQGKTTHLSFRVNALPVDFGWGSNAIGDIAKKHGLKKVHYTDVEELSILGFWKTYTVHVYGE